MKKIVAVMLSVLLLSYSMLVANAEILTKEVGTTTESFDTETGALTITGSGSIREGLYNLAYPVNIYYTVNNYPWSANSMRSLVLEGVNSIRYGSFYSHKNLESVVMSDSLITIENESFKDCLLLKNVIFSNNLKYINEDAFMNCTLLSKIVIPDSVEYIEDNAFYGCSSLSEIVLPKGLSDIGNDCFKNTLLWNSSDNWEDGVFYIGNTAVDYDNETNALHNIEIVLRENTDTLVNGFLASTDVRAITFPEGMNSISEATCYDCNYLVAAFIPDSVTEIEEDAFKYCEYLTIYCNEGSYAQQYAIENAIPYDTVNKDLSNALTAEQVESLLTKYVYNNTFEYKINLDGDIVITAYTGNAGSVGIPAEIEGKKVVALDINRNDSFAYAKAIYIPESVNYISPNAFESADSLTRISYAGDEADWKQIVEMAIAESETGENPFADIDVNIKNISDKETDAPKDTPQPSGKFIMGDVNSDGAVNAKDALVILKHAAKLEVLDNHITVLAADVTDDTSIDASDALEVLRFAAGLRAEFGYINAEDIS